MTSTDDSYIKTECLISEEIENMHALIVHGIRSMRSFVSVILAQSRGNRQFLFRNVLLKKCVYFWSTSDEMYFWRSQKRVAVVHYTIGFSSPVRQFSTATFLHCCSERRFSKCEASPPRRGAAEFLKGGWRGREYSLKVFSFVSIGCIYMSKAASSRPIRYSQTDSDSELYFDINE